MFVFEFDAVLFRFNVKTPQLAPLFQLPPYKQDALSPKLRGEFID